MYERVAAAFWRREEIQDGEQTSAEEEDETEYVKPTCWGFPLDLKTIFRFCQKLCSVVHLIKTVTLNDIFITAIDTVNFITLISMFRELRLIDMVYHVE